MEKPPPKNRPPQKKTRPLPLIHRTQQLTQKCTSQNKTSKSFSELKILPLFCYVSYCK